MNTIVRTTCAISTSLLIWIATTLISASTAIPSVADTSNTETQAKQAFLSNSPPTTQVAHISVADGYALVEWLRGQAGGEALLVESNNQWQIVTGGGGSMNSSFLIAHGVPESTAVELVQQLQSQWSH